MADANAELKAMQEAFAALSKLDSEQQVRALTWIVSSLGLTDLKVPGVTEAIPSAHAQDGAESSQQAKAPVDDGTSSGAPLGDIKTFMTSKRPANNAERVTCLAYFLAKQGITAFKSPDIAKANTEAAQPRMSNPRRDVANAADQSGYLVSAGGGKKQISARGEALVEALPDRDAVKEALAQHPMRRRAKRAATKKAAASEPQKSNGSAKKVTKASKTTSLPRA